MSVQRIVIRQTVGWLAAMGLLASLNDAPVAAQNQPSAGSNATSAPRAGWTFTPSFTTSGGWDSNILLLGSAQPIRGDYGTGLTPAGALDYNGPRLRFTSGYRGVFTLYRELTELNSVDQMGRAELRYQATPRVTLTLGQSVYTAQTTDLIEFVGVPFQRIGNWTSTTHAGLGVRLNSRTTARGQYGHRVVTFDDDVGFLAFPGGREQIISSAVDHRLSPRLTIGGTYAFQRMILSDDPTPIQLHHPSATTEYRITEFFTVKGSAGFDYLSAVAGEPSQSGFAFGAGVVGTLKYVTLGAQYEKSMVPSFGFGGTFDNEEFSGQIRGEFARRRAFWQASAAWRNNEPVIPGPPSARSVWLSGLTGYAIWPWLRIEGYYSLSTQDSQRPGGHVNRNRVGFQVVTLKPLPLGR
jgi:hypothetical protein